MAHEWENLDSSRIVCSKCGAVSNSWEFATPDTPIVRGSIQEWSSGMQQIRVRGNYVPLAQYYRNHPDLDIFSSLALTCEQLIIKKTMEE